MTTLSQLNRIIRLQKYLFSVPEASTAFLIMFLVSMFFSIIGIRDVQKVEYFVFLFVPSVLSAILSKKAVEIAGGDLKNKHTFFLSLFSMVTCAIILLVYSFLENFLSFTITEIILTLLALVFALNLLVFRVAACIPLHKAAMPAIIYPAISFAVLSIFLKIHIYEFFAFAIMLLLAHVMILLFIHIADAMLMKTVGAKIMPIVSFFMREFIGDLEKKENPFEKLGKDIEVPYQVLAFEGKKQKYVFAVPWLHPGPIGTIGGNMPSELRKVLSTRFEDAVFLHTYVDHTHDPISSDIIVPKLHNLTSEILKNSKKILKGTRAIKIEKDGITLIGQRLGNVFVFFSSFAPEITEDVETSIGLMLLEKFNGRAIFVDAHNSNTLSDNEDNENVSFGDKRAKILINGIQELSKKIATEKEYPVKFGMYSWDTDPNDIGISNICVVSMEINAQRIAYAILDTNNLVPNFRERVVQKLLRDFDIAEIITTDAHLADTAMTLHGKIGMHKDIEVEQKILEVAKKSSLQLSDVHMQYGIANFSTRVFGESFHSILATLNSLIPTAKLLSISFIALFLAIAYALFLLFRYSSFL